MTTLRAIVTAANRDLGILAEAEEAPAEMAARGLRLAQGVILDAVTLAGGAWRDVDILPWLKGVVTDGRTFCECQRAKRLTALSWLSLPSGQLRPARADAPARA